MVPKLSQSQVIPRFWKSGVETKIFDTTVRLYSLVRSTVYGSTLTANISQSEDSIVTTSYCFNMYLIFTFYIMTIISITDLYVPLQ